MILTLAGMFVLGIFIVGCSGGEPTPTSQNKKDAPSGKAPGPNKG